MPAISSHCQNARSTVCAGCGKNFKTVGGMLSHMNHPYSRCRLRQEALKRVASRRDCPSSLEDLTHPSLPTVLTFESPDDVIYTSGSFLAEAPMDDPESSHRSAQPHFQPAPASEHLNIVYHPHSAQTYGHGTTFLDIFKNDKYAEERNKNTFYPFASWADWEVGLFLLRSPMSKIKIDQFLKLHLISGISLSFKSADELRSKAELLPKTPVWKAKPWTTAVSTKSPITLFYRDPLECIQAILHNPLLKDQIQFKPFQLFRSAEGAMRVYTEWLSGDAAWRMQDELPPGATLLGVILSSDKTQISRLTGNRSAHPLLISLANLNMEFRNKVSNNAFLLLALLPIPEFIHRVQRIRTLLADRLFHECIDFILQPLKKAAEVGVMMSDPLGWRRLCYTPLAAYIVDSPEAALIAGTGGKTSALTLATIKDFGDGLLHPARTALHTLTALHYSRQAVDPEDYEEYLKFAFQNHRLSGVDKLFWSDWPQSDPSIFLTPEPLHHWHKAFGDHDLQWCSNMVGAAELDFRFTILHPHTGFRHFNEGVSRIKQVTGREHRDIQRHLVAVVAGALSKDCLIAIRALMDFRYLGQSLQIDDNTIGAIQDSLALFHSHKKALLKAKARRGKGNIPLTHFNIPKLEFLQSVPSNIALNGIPMQWSADITERAHIVVVKEPVEHGNNRNHESHICRFLDRKEKCDQFVLGTAMLEARVELGAATDENDCDFEELEATTGSKLTGDVSELLAALDPVGSFSSSVSRPTKNYFEVATGLVNKLQNPDADSDPSIHIKLPLRTFTSMDNRTAYHFKRDPSFKRMSIEEAATRFKIPDFHAALGDYIRLCRSSSTPNRVHVSSLGGRRHSSSTCSLPFHHIEVWDRFYLQSKSFYAPYSVQGANTVNAIPPPTPETTKKTEWIYGRHDPVIVNLDAAKKWPYSGLSGHQVVEIKILFRIVPARGEKLADDCFLAYVGRFDIIPQVNKDLSGSATRCGPYPEPASSLFILNRARRTDGSPLGDIIPVRQIKELVELVPRFGEKADRRLTRYNSLDFWSEFYLNKYFTKELFLALNNSSGMEE